MTNIATRTYCTSKPPGSLPDAAINAGVMNPMIERWQPEWITTFRPSEFKILNNLDALSTDEIERDAAGQSRWRAQALAYHAD
ncbi:MAG: hypothetical protein KA252_01785 [Sphingorhabdus sp.]|nr:hypothetical protein [Sphingorhabdus sp.]